MRSIRGAASLAGWLAAMGACACSSQLAPPMGAGGGDDGSPHRGGRIAIASFVGIRSIDPAVAFDEGADPI